MKIEHAALWTNDLERMKVFFEKYFAARANNRYQNLRTGFESYFLTFEGGARLEIMRIPDLAGADAAGRRVGLAHLAFSVGSKEQVDQLTERLKADGYEVVSAVRTTGDGYYESVIRDPDGNLLEITV